MPRTHQLSNTRLYSIWKTMKSRCNNPKRKDWSCYGGRGIKVCREWDVFINFYEWAMFNGYKDGLTLDRKDVNKDYSPGNCCWVTRKEQSRNKRNTVYATYNGERKTLAEISEITGISIFTLYSALDHTEDFANYKPRHAAEKYINKHGNKYQLIYKSKYIGRYETIEEAISVRDSLIEKEAING